MNARRVLVTGAGGMVGSELLRLAPPGWEAVGLRHQELDVSDWGGTRAALAEHRPACVLHVGAWTNVDGCETDPERAFLVNGLGPRNVAAAAARVGAAVVYVSTDYVFDGAGTRPYLEHDPPAPRSVYGRSKLAGEQAVLGLLPGRAWVVRTQWIYGFSGRNFVDTILAAAREGKPLRVVDDQVGCPTWARELAGALWRIVREEPPGGVYHASANGECSWFDLTREVLRLAGVTPASLEPMKSTELDRPAPRPAYSVLRNLALERTLGDPMRDWRAALADYLAARVAAAS